jgi:hypothetical protein
MSNTKYPFPVNDGAGSFIKGDQFKLSVGLNFITEKLFIQFMPEIYSVQQKKYRLYDPARYGNLFANRYLFYNQMEYDLNHFDSSYLRFFPGQSSIYWRYDNEMMLGVSTENLWWGPGRFNALTFSNSAPGFLHSSFKTIKPGSVFGGSLVLQMIMGLLNNSNQEPPFSNEFVRNLRFSVEKRNEDRFLSGLNIVFNPNFIEGVSVGFINIVQQYASSLQPYDLFSSFLSGFDRSFGSESRSTPRYQLESYYFKWMLFETNSEIYFEWAKQNPTTRFNDFIINPRDRSAFLAGFNHIIELPKNKYLFEIEFINLQQPSDNLIDNRESMYIDNSIRQGFTHYGQAVGPAIGPGSNHLFFRLQKISENMRLGMSFERYEPNKDLYILNFSEITDFRRWWVDHAVGFLFSFELYNLTVDSSLKYIRSVNYQYNHPVDPSQPYFQPGLDIGSFQGFINLSYNLAN